jgi:2-isopropylmalate synthase
MEHVNSERVGNQRKIILSELAGKSTIVKRLTKYGNFDKNSEEVSRILATLKTREAAGYEYEAAEASFDLLVRKELRAYTPLIELNNYHLESYKTGTSRPKTVGDVPYCGGKQLHGAGHGLRPGRNPGHWRSGTRFFPIYPYIAIFTPKTTRCCSRIPRRGSHQG